MEKETKNIELVPATSTALTQTPKPRTYWDRAAGIYKTAFRVLLVALPLYVIVFVAFCARAFTYESVFCLFKDLQAATSFVTSEYESVTYTYGEEQYVLSYRGGVAAVGKDGIEIYSPDGELLFVKEHTGSKRMAKPRAVASRKYLIAYDLGNTGFTVTNTYASVLEGNLDFPIYMAEVADTGHFALVTLSDDDFANVYLYNENCRLVHCFETDFAVTGVAISENGRYVAIAGLASRDGEAESRVEIYRLGEYDDPMVYTAGGELPLALDFTSNRYVALLTDAALCVLDADGNVKSRVAHTGDPVAFESNEYGCVLVTRTDAVRAENRVLLLDKKGKLLCDTEVKGDIDDVSLVKNRAFLLTRKGVVAVSDDGELRSIECDAGARGLLAIDEDRVRVIYDGEARLLTID